MHLSLAWEVQDYRQSLASWERVEGALLTQRTLCRETEVFGAGKNLSGFAATRRQVRRLKGTQHRATAAVNVRVATPQEGTDDPRNKEKLTHTAKTTQKAPETYYKVYTIRRGINLCSGSLEGRLSRLLVQEIWQVTLGPRTLPSGPQVDPAVAG